MAHHHAIDLTRNRFLFRVSVGRFPSADKCAKNGKLIVSALNQRDYTVLQGMMVVYAFIIVLVNLLTDLTYGFIDPRVKRQ